MKQYLYNKLFKKCIAGKKETGVESFMENAPKACAYPTHMYGVVELDSGSYNLIPDEATAFTVMVTLDGDDETTVLEGIFAECSYSVYSDGFDWLEAYLGSRHSSYQVALDVDDCPVIVTTAEQTDGSVVRDILNIGPEDEIYTATWYDGNTYVAIRISRRAIEVEVYGNIDDCAIGIDGTLDITSQSEEEELSNFLDSVEELLGEKYLQIISEEFLGEVATYRLASKEQRDIIYNIRCGVVTEGELIKLIDRLECMDASFGDALKALMDAFEEATGVTIEILEKEVANQMPLAEDESAV